MKELEKQNEWMSKENVELKRRLAEQERYRMLWSISIIGIEEKKDEDIRAIVIQILSRVIPDLESKLEDAVDVMHRMMDKRHRLVIILLFTDK